MAHPLPVRHCYHRLSPPSSHVLSPPLPPDTPTHLPRLRSRSGSPGRPPLPLPPDHGEPPSPSLTPDPGHGAVVSSFPNPPHRIQRRAGDHVLRRGRCSGVWRPPSCRRRSSLPPQGPRSSRHGQGARGHGDLVGTTGGGRPWRHRIWQPRSPESSTWLGRDGGRLGPHHRERKASVSAAPLFPCSSSRSSSHLRF